MLAGCILLASFNPRWYLSLSSEGVVALSALAPGICRGHAEAPQPRGALVAGRAAASVTRAFVSIPRILKLALQDGELQCVLWSRLGWVLRRKHRAECIRTDMNGSCSIRCVFLNGFTVLVLVAMFCHLRHRPCLRRPLRFVMQSRSCGGLRMNATCMAANPSCGSCMHSHGGRYQIAACLMSHAWSGPCQQKFCQHTNAPPPSKPPEPLEKPPATRQQPASHHHQHHRHHDQHNHHERYQQLKYKHQHEHHAVPCRDGGR